MAGVSALTALETLPQVRLVALKTSDHVPEEPPREDSARCGFRFPRRAAAFR
jgi:hypothetical protein